MGPVGKFDKGRAMAERFESLVPGGSHTYSRGRDQFPFLSPQIVAGARGAYFWDPDGNRFLDWAMGVRAVILGHAYPAVDEAVKAQIDKGVHYTRPGVAECELAEFLVDLLPVAEMVKFAKNGSDVTTAAVKLARAYTGRPYVAYCAEHPFFSIHDWFIGTTPANGGIPDEAYRHTLRFSYNDLGSVEALFAEHPGKIAALILEPVKSDAPAAGFLEGLRAITQREGAVLIFDEMISGMRFDIRGAHHRWGVYPDLATYGKAMSNGYSFSLLAGKRDLMELGGLRHDRRRVFLLSQTHGPETTGLAACRATLEECLRVDINRHIDTIGGRLVEGFRSLAAAEGVADHVRVTGFDCNPHILCTRRTGEYWPELHTAFHEEVISHGVVIPWISITYSHGDEELARTFDAVREGMRRVRRAIDEAPGPRFTGEAVKPVFRPFNRCRQAVCGRLNPSAPQLDCCLSDGGPRP
ncbi:MAG TPA: glutamate-1-semialdehyde 2,1-aminomutase [Thermoanaerobaculia bacterium]|nr:glutamate-1-semialdehyde 2,1-aminomutase [Thermoanaerobaculia bacterium]